jgi:hypothetical protein
LIENCKLKIENSQTKSGVRKGVRLLNKKLRIAVIIAVLAVSTVAVPSALAKSNDPKPGWGYGDKNHVHVGPPGQSVHPDNDKIVKRLEKQEDHIVNKLEKNKKIPEPQKTNLINQVKDLFEKLIGLFS